MRDEGWDAESCQFLTRSNKAIILIGEERRGLGEMKKGKGVHPLLHSLHDDRHSSDNKTLK
jgi:hypothetical protein